MVSVILPLQMQGVVVRRRGKRLLGPIDLSIDQTGITVVLGPNGAGKTTLLKTLHGLEKLSGGTLQWQVTDAAARARQAYVFQTPIMLRRSVRQNLAYPLMLAGTPRAEVEHCVADWAARIGLADALDRRAPRLSGGEKQKLALARALIRTPEILFLDEPCASLDGGATREIETLLKKAADDGIRIVMATHDMGQARRLADDVLFLLDGVVHERGPAATCLTTPRTPELRAFLQGDIVE